MGILPKERVCVGEEASTSGEVPFFVRPLNMSSTPCTLYYFTNEHITPEVVWITWFLSMSVYGSSVLGWK